LQTLPDAKELTQKWDTPHAVSAVKHGFSSKRGAWRMNLCMPPGVYSIDTAARDLVVLVGVFTQLAPASAAQKRGQHRSAGHTRLHGRREDQRPCFPQGTGGVHHAVPSTHPPAATRARALLIAPTSLLHAGPVEYTSWRKSKHVCNFWDRWGATFNIQHESRTTLT